MQYHTHLIFGMCAWEGLDLLSKSTNSPSVDFDNPMLIGVFALGVLFPDIDEPRSLIGRRAPLLSLPLSSIVKHRGVTHTIIFMILISLALYALLGNFGIENFTQIAFAFFFGNLMHALGDMHTKSGVVLLSPISKKAFHLLPSPLRIATGSPSEQILFLLYGSLFIFLAQLGGSSYGGAMEAVNKILGYTYKAIDIGF